MSALRLLTENLRMALEALGGNLLRSSLAVLGIVVGVFVVITLVSLGEMAARGIQRDLERLSARGAFILPNADARGVTPALGDEELVRLRQLGFRVLGNTGAAADVLLPDGSRGGVNLQGDDGDLPVSDPTVRLRLGRYYSGAEARSGAPVAVLSDATARDLLPGPQGPLGRTVRVLGFDGSRRDLTVVGVLEPPVGSAAGFSGGLQMRVPTPLLWAGPLSNARGQYTSIQVLVSRSEDLPARIALIQRLLDARQPGKFGVSSSESGGEQLSGINRTLQTLLGAVAGLSLLVGGIGIMNTLLGSVTERTREIGLRKALGAPAALIRGQFLIEATLLTGLGGALGLLLAVGALLLAPRLLPQLGEFVLRPQTVLLTLGICTALGLIFGTAPAARAARLDPIEALRYE